MSPKHSYHEHDFHKAVQTVWQNTVNQWPLNQEAKNLFKNYGLNEIREQLMIVDLTDFKNFKKKVSHEMRSFNINDEDLDSLFASFIGNEKRPLASVNRLSRLLSVLVVSKITKTSPKGRDENTPPLPTSQQKGR